MSDPEVRKILDKLQKLRAMRDCAAMPRLSKRIPDSGST
jgi:hypothetical protein